jgi:hypothetical protein
MTADGDTYQIEYERLWSVFRHAPLTLSVTVLNAVLVATVLALPMAPGCQPAGPSRSL